jgi:N-acetylglucosamine malate deacetylase 2
MDTSTPAVRATELGPRIGSPRRAVAVVAHPDDESFGLGALLSALVDAGTSVAVVCLTHGEASTLGAAPDLGTLRDAELRAAAIELGIADVALFDYADGHLADAEPVALLALVDSHLGAADLVVAFEAEGVTGHPDHRAATAVARAVAAHRGIALLEWGVSPAVAAGLRDELGAPFVALDTHPGADVFDVEVDRARQLAAIACHGSQATDNPVLRRRLERQGACERVRWWPPPVEPPG